MINNQLVTKILGMLNNSSSCFIENFGSPCRLPWIMTSLLCNGKIFPCCGDFMPETPKEGNWFNKIYNDTNIIKLRQNLAAGKIPYACLSCRKELN